VPKKIFVKIANIRFHVRSSRHSRDFLNNFNAIMFSTQEEFSGILSRTSGILSRTNVRLHANCLSFLYYFNKTWIWSTDFSKNPQTNLSRNPFSRKTIVPCEWRDKQTDRKEKADRHDEL